MATTVRSLGAGIRPPLPWVQGLQIMGSASLVHALISHGLVDEYRLMIEPILLGGGKRLFPDDGEARTLQLTSTTTASTGVLICTYRPVAPG